MLNSRLGLSIYVSIWPSEIEVVYYFTDGTSSYRLEGTPCRDSDAKTDLLGMCRLTEGFYLVVTDYTQSTPDNHVPTYHQGEGFLHLGWTEEQYAEARGE